jgi:hypothetical protein
MKNSVIAHAIGLGLIAAVAAQAAPTVEEVGDPDSFGRDVIYLGNAQTANVALQADCTPDPSAPPLPNDRCVTLAAQPSPTIWNEDGLATLQLPADSTKSLICFALTPNVNYEYNNLTGVAQPNARFTARAVITIENEVLDDPTLIDPNTGLPYGGKMTLPLSTWSESRSIAPGEREQKSMFLSRHCIGGLVSKRSLVGSGLSETQAKQFFKKPMKFTFGASGTVQIVDSANYFYGIRLYGDSKDR